MASPASTLGNEDLGLREPRTYRVPGFSVSLPESSNENRAASTPAEQLTQAPGCRCGNFGGTQFPCLVAANSLHITLFPILGTGPNLVIIVDRGVTELGGLLLFKVCVWGGGVRIFM